MQTVDDEIQTIHLYVVKEEEKKPFVFLPLFFAFLCLISIAAVTTYSWQHPTYEHETLLLPAHFFTRTFSATARIVPTGSKTYPAIQAHGILTLYNGSVITQTIPQGMIITSTTGVQIVVQDTITVAAGDPPNYGMATVAAYAQLPGTAGNIAAYAVNQILGSALYIRNTHPFTGGKDSYSVKVVTLQDRQTAIDAAKASLTAQKATTTAFLAFPCKESSQIKNNVVGLFWTCQYVSYTIASYMKVIHVRLVGNHLLVDVMFVVKPRRMQSK